MEKKDSDIIDLTPDGQKVDHYADDGKSLAEKALQKKPPSKDDRKPRVEEKEPTFWERLSHAFWEMFK
jgi:hypothetical protein